MFLKSFRGRSAVVPGAGEGGTETWAAHAQLQSWGAQLSVALQKANARNLRSALGVGGPPSRYGVVLEDLLREGWADPWADCSESPVGE